MHHQQSLLQPCPQISRCLANSMRTALLGANRFNANAASHRARKCARSFGSPRWRGDCIFPRTATPETTTEDNRPRKR